VWKKLIFRQLEPLHIGALNFGVISVTRLFIPGWTMWGALVADWGYKHGAKQDIFEQAGQIFNVLTCFFPAIGRELLLPKYKNGDLYFGPYKEIELRDRITDTFVSTAIDLATSAAKEKTLHETEYILTRDKVTHAPLSWTGLLMIQEKDLEDYLRPGLELWVGGERRYGMGRIQLVKAETVNSDELQEIWGLNDDGGAVNPNDLSLKNYLQIPCSNEMNFEGGFEQVLLIPFHDRTKEAEMHLCLVPGTIVDLQANNSITYSLQKGIFKSIPESPSSSEDH